MPSLPLLKQKVVKNLRATSLPSEALLRCIAPPSGAPPCILRALHVLPISLLLRRLLGCLSNHNALSSEGVAVRLCCLPRIIAGLCGTTVGLPTNPRSGNSLFLGFKNTHIGGAPRHQEEPGPQHSQQTLQKGAPDTHVEGPKSNKERQNREDSLPSRQKLGWTRCLPVKKGPHFLTGWQRVRAILPFFV